jgi:hypothetical protein
MLVKVSCRNGKRHSWKLPLRGGEPKKAPEIPRTPHRL